MGREKGSFLYRERKGERVGGREDDKPTAAVTMKTAATRARMVGTTRRWRNDREKERSRECFPSEAMQFQCRQIPYSRFYFEYANHKWEKSPHGRRALRFRPLDEDERWAAAMTTTADSRKGLSLVFILSLAMDNSTIISVLWTKITTTTRLGVSLFVNMRKATRMMATMAATTWTSSCTELPPVLRSSLTIPRMNASP